MAYKANHFANYIFKLKAKIIETLIKVIPYKNLVIPDNCNRFQPDNVALIGDQDGGEVIS